jgi:hypothetical protein
MKKQIMKVVATLSLLVPMSIGAFAALDGRVNVNIPFDFNVGDKEFKAGKYYVDRYTSTNTLIIRSSDNKDSANFIVSDQRDKSDEGKARLVFNRYGSQSFLSQIYDGIDPMGNKLGKSKTEREAAKKSNTITQNHGEPEVISIAAVVGK